MICNILISAAAMTRYTDRMAGKAADNAVELFWISAIMMRWWNLCGPICGSGQSKYINTKSVLA